MTAPQPQPNREIPIYNLVEDPGRVTFNFGPRQITVDPVEEFISLRARGLDETKDGLQRMTIVQKHLQEVHDVHVSCWHALTYLQLLDHEDRKLGHFFAQTLSSHTGSTLTPANSAPEQNADTSPTSND